MKKLFMLMFVCALIGGQAWAQTEDLIISEYVEGSGNNKALELYNGTGDDIDLGAMAIERYSNGSISAISIALDAVVLGSGNTWVLANPQADAAVLAVADQLSGDINFNGNDALVLVRNGDVVDSFGRVGEDPGIGWSCQEGTTVNSTLRRLATICSGDTDPFDVFDPCLEYAFEPSDYFDGLGDHVVDCNSVPIRDASWGEVKSIYR